MITVEHLTKSFRKKVAVNDFSYSFGNKIYGLLGPNGAGKTTLLRCLAGLYNYNKGAVTENGTEISKLKESQRSIGYLPQKFGMFPNLKVKEMLEYFSIQKNIQTNDEDILNCIELVGLEDKANEKISTLSGGMIRRLGIAQALLGEPSLVLFDEPTAGLDPEERIRFKNIVLSLKNKCTVILSTHIVSDVSALCEEILIMNDSSLIFSGSGSQVISLAQGKVYLVSENERDKLTGEYHIQGQENKNGEVLMRIISDNEQPFKKVEATIEDGYICCVRNI